MTRQPPGVKSGLDPGDGRLFNLELNRRLRACPMQPARKTAYYNDRAFHPAAHSLDRFCSFTYFAICSSVANQTPGLVFI